MRKFSSLTSPLHNIRDRFKGSRGCDTWGSQINPLNKTNFSPFLFEHKFIQILSEKEVEAYGKKNKIRKKENVTKFTHHK